MNNKEIDKLQAINDFPDLVGYLRDELDWPIETNNFDDLTFDYTAEELGMDDDSAAKILEIKRLRPLDNDQPWGIFFVSLEPKRLPVVALRRLLSKVALKKRATSNKADQAAWHADDILFISSFGAEQDRQLSFAHFAVNEAKKDLPILKVLGWDNKDTKLHIDSVVETLKEKLVWPDDTEDTEAWRQQWRKAFNLRYKEVVNTSKDMAIRLAELARNIRDSIKAVLKVESDKGPLRQIMKTFRDALIHDLDDAGFADMYAQTIAYGLLSARIADPKGSNTVEHLGDHMRTNPFLKELMETFLDVGGRKKGKQKGAGLDFDELGVSEVVDLLDNANMEAVVRDFGDRNPLEDPVIHFYESFLKEYDAQKRVQRGVYYTPQPVVSFIVRSVHELLQMEFGLEDGLADVTTWGEMIERKPELTLPPLTDESGEKRTISPDEPFVQILDPATGTATFPVEVIEIIYQTMMAKWERLGLSKKKKVDAWNDYVPEHLLPRLHAYELMMAPYAIAHMKVGLKLVETGYEFESNQRAGIYLTNALAPADEAQIELSYMPALANESRAVGLVKKQIPFTVVIGNPPYSHMTSNLNDYAMSLVEPYKYIDGVRLKERGALSFQKNLQDDYIKFIRFSEMLATRSGECVVGIVTNHSFLTNPTFRGLRFSLINTFNKMTFIDLHGNSLYREARGIHADDKNVFDIQQGVAVSLLVSSKELKINESIFRGDIWGDREKKYSVLGEYKVDLMGVEEINPAHEFYVFRPEDASLREEYSGYSRITDLMPIYSSGVKTHRDHFSISFDYDDLFSRVEDFRNLKISDDTIREKYALKDTKPWRLHDRRKSISCRDDYLSNMTKTQNRPFDYRWIYYHADIVELPRHEVMNNLLGKKENMAICFTRNTREDWRRHVFITRSIVHKDAVSTLDSCYAAPLLIQDEFFGVAGDEVGFSGSPNFSSEVFVWFESLKKCGGPSLDENMAMAYFYGVLYSNKYSVIYAQFLKIDFPRVPLSVNIDLVKSLVDLGLELIDMHLLEFDIKDYGTPSQNHLIGKVVEKVSFSTNTVWINSAKNIGFNDVSEEVWKFKIGGYQVCEKWLKDRAVKGGKNPSSGRSLTDEDVAHYQKIIVAITETIRIMKEIDEVIEQYGGWPGAFSSSEEKSNVHGEIERERSEDSVVPITKEINEYPASVTPIRLAADSAGASENSAPLITDLNTTDIVCAIRSVMTRGGARTREQLIKDTSECLGYGRVGENNRREIDNAIKAAVRRKVLVNFRTELAIDERNIENYDKSHLKQQFLASMPNNTWVERNDAIRNFARWMGYERTGPKIKDSAKSMINGLLRTDKLEKDGDYIRKI